MKKILAIVAVVITVLTLLTLLLDLPGKVKRAYATVTKSPPAVQTKALFGNQEAFSMSPISDDSTQGYSDFLWPAVYEFHNVSDTDVAIQDIVNILPPVQAGDHQIRLVATDDPDRIVTLYQSFEDLTAEVEAGTTERLPISVRAGSKLYVKVYVTYHIRDGDRAMFCDPQSRCYRLLALALGAPVGARDDVPCIRKSFETRVDFVNYRSKRTKQEAILLIPGCKLNLEKLLEGFVKEESQS